MSPPLRPACRLQSEHRPARVDVAAPLRRPNGIGDITSATRLLAAFAEESDAVGVFVNNTVMIEDVAVLRPGPRLPAAKTDCLDRVLVLHHPGHLVQAVDVLLDVVI